MELVYRDLLGEELSQEERTVLERWEDIKTQVKKNIVEHYGHPKWNWLLNKLLHKKNGTDIVKIWDIHLNQR